MSSPSPKINRKGHWLILFSLALFFSNSLRAEELTSAQIADKFENSELFTPLLDNFYTSGNCPSNNIEWASRQESLARLFSLEYFLESIALSPELKQLVENIFDCMEKGEKHLEIIDINGCFSGFLEYADFFEKLNLENARAKKMLKTLSQETLKGKRVLTESRNQEEEMAVSLPYFLTDTDFFRSLKKGSASEIDQNFTNLRSQFLLSKNNTKEAGREFFHEIEGGLMEALEEPLDRSRSLKRFVIVTKSQYVPKPGEKSREIRRNISFTSKDKFSESGPVFLVSNYAKVDDVKHIANRTKTETRYYSRDWEYHLTDREAPFTRQSTTKGLACHTCHQQGTLAFKSPLSEMKYYNFTQYFNNMVKKDKEGLQFHEGNFYENRFLNTGYQYHHYQQGHDKLGLPLLSGVPYEYRKDGTSSHQTTMRCGDCHTTFPDSAQRKILMIPPDSKSLFFPFLEERLKTGHGLKSPETRDWNEETDEILKALQDNYASQYIANEGNKKLKHFRGGSLFERLMNRKQCTEFQSNVKRLPNPSLEFVQDSYSKETLLTDTGERHKK